MLTAEQKKEIIAQYAVHEGDTGSPDRVPRGGDR